eukprot:CAMPEP_0116851826 /NCGR_PEP_ID=MMETSP0418-20121206/16948_1 /TAXON_ID=1158023 /ORGANISM="Astrosyne radiata, Strain 13vi08-1A" /LENGTH=469 /DNA_ID=CAMNT_0004483911 /DNA_START=565 /DNA_END=1974 /DNA_ORIENTATION=+
MESSAAAAERPAGIESDIRTMVEAAQGPQPLANVYTGRSPCIPFQTSSAIARMAAFGSTSPPVMASISVHHGVGPQFSPYPPPPARASVMEPPAPPYMGGIASAEGLSSEDSKPPASHASQSPVPPQPHHDPGTWSSPDDELPPMESPLEALPAASLPPDSPPMTLRLRKRKAPEVKHPPAAAKRPPNTRVRAGLKTDPDVDESGTCCICMCEPEIDDVATINGCEHQFCFGCIEKWADRENTCPLCKNRFSKIDRVHKAKRQKGDPQNTKKVKNRDQRADLNPGNTLEGLLAGLGASNPFPPQIARLIFSGIGGPGNNVVELNAPTSSAGARRTLGRFQMQGFRSTAAASLNPPDAFLDSDEDADTPPEDEQGFGNFRESLRTLPLGRRSGAVFGAFATMQTTRPSQAAAAAFAASLASASSSPPPSRSYARNASDAHAGVTADNALEIDDDSDDEIEVVEVASRRPL